MRGTREGHNEWRQQSYPGAGSYPVPWFGQGANPYSHPPEGLQAPLYPSQQQKQHHPYQPQGPEAYQYASQSSVLPPFHGQHPPIFAPSYYTGEAGPVMPPFQAQYFPGPEQFPGMPGPYYQGPPMSHYPPHAFDQSWGPVAAEVPRGPSKEDIIRDLEESRLKVEAPCRTLFVRNLGFRANGRRIAEAFAKYGPLKETADLIDKRGLMFITFFDVRHAEKALKGLHNSVVESRKLDVHFSLPKQDVDVQASCSKEHNQGTLLVQLIDPTEPVAPTELERIVRVHGDVARTRDFKTNERKKYFEFYDSRDCAKAYSALSGSTFKGGRVEVEFAWDLPESKRLAQASLRGDPLRDGRARPFPQTLSNFVPPLPVPYYVPSSVATAHGRQEYDRYAPEESVMDAHVGSANVNRRRRRGNRRSRSRSRSPERTSDRARAMVGTSAVPLREPPLAGTTVEFFEDRSGDRAKPQDHRPMDPRLIKGRSGSSAGQEKENSAPLPSANVASPIPASPEGSSNQLFEQMSNLLSILNSQHTASAPGPSSVASNKQVPAGQQPGPPSTSAAQHLAELLLHQAVGQQQALQRR